MTSQTTSRSQLVQPSPKIIEPHTTMPRIATTGSAGTLKPRGTSGRRTRMIHTPAHTRMNANSVPMLVMSPTMFSGTNAAKSAVKKKNMMFDFYGVRNVGWTSEKTFGTSPSSLIE